MIRASHERPARPRHDPDQPLLREGAVGAGPRRRRLRGAPPPARAASGGGRAGGHTAPVLVCPQGKVLGESADIVYWADARAATPAARMIPEDPELAREA